MRLKRLRQGRNKTHNLLGNPMPVWTDDLTTTLLFKVSEVLQIF